MGEYWTDAERFNTFDEKEIEDRFYCDLEFGTGGLRGVRFVFRAESETTDPEARFEAVLFDDATGETLETVVPPYEKHKMHAIEVADFIESVNDRHKSVNHIDYVLESAKLLDALYQSAEIQKEIAF